MSFFGPSKEEIWSDVAHELGGEFKDGGFWGKDVLTYQHGDWEILLDTYTTKVSNTYQSFTRVRAPFVNRDGLQFTIYNQSIFSSIGKFFGMQDLEIGEPYFDQNFVIKGNDPHQIEQLFLDQHIQGLLIAMPNIRFEIRDDEGFFGPHFDVDVDELYLATSGIVKDKEILKSLIELFARTINKLVDIGSIEIAQANITLR